MELQDQFKSDWSRYFCHQQPPMEFDTSPNHHLLSSELKSSSARLEGNSDPYCSIWTDVEQPRVNSCNNRSFAMDARIRLDSLKSGCSSPLPYRSIDGMLYNYNCKKDIWDCEESREDSALDSVELLNVEDDVQDEESWLYQSQKKQVFEERTDSALGWCRHVLDNPSPEVEVACRVLRNKLDQRSSSHLYRRPEVFHHTGHVSVDKTSVSTAHNTSDSLDNNELSISHDSITTSYRLQDITDVHIMARIQEASLREDYVSTPRRSSESPRGPSSLSSSSGQSPTSGCQSPKLTRLHQQVTQFKLLKLAQNQAASPSRTRSPLRTSLRSLQAVRNSRSLEIDDCQPADLQITRPPSGASSVSKGSSCWSPSLPAASLSSNGSSHSERDSSVRTTVVNRLHRSQSASPCRIPHPAKGYLSVNGRVFASPERSTTVAWGRNVPSTRR